MPTRFWVSWLRLPADRTSAERRPRQCGARSRAVGLFSRGSRHSVSCCGLCSAWLIGRLGTVLAANPARLRHRQPIAHQPAAVDALAFLLQIGARLAYTEGAPAIVQLHHEQRLAQHRYAVADAVSADLARRFHPLAGGE